MKELIENEQGTERALLISLDTGEYDAQTSLEELGELTESAGADPAFTLTQKRPAPETATCLGSGMAEEAAQLIRREELDLSCATCCPGLPGGARRCPGWAAASAPEALAKPSWKPTGGISGGALPA